MAKALLHVHIDALDAVVGHWVVPLDLVKEEVGTWGQVLLEQQTVGKELEVGDKAGVIEAVVIRADTKLCVDDGEDVGNEARDFHGLGHVLI